MNNHLTLTIREIERIHHSLLHIGGKFLNGFGIRCHHGRGILGLL